MRKILMILSSSTLLLLIRHGEALQPAPLLPTATTTTKATTTRRQHMGQQVAFWTTSSLVVTTTTTAAPSVANAEGGAKTLLKIGQAFPGAMSNEELLAAVTDQLSKKGFQADTTLVGSSFCSDEVNRPLEDTFEKYYGNHFAMGGLAGFPFSGVTGFGAMASHIPDGGNALLVYGPHVGVDSDGLVGKVNRRGKAKSGTCCGSAVAATKYLKAVVNGQGEIMPPPGNALDAQQVFVSNMLLPYASEITESENPMVTLPFLTFKPIDNMMNRIVAQMSTKVGEKGRIAMLGGLQINTPDGLSDYFLPLRFDVRESTNELVADLLETL